MSEDKKDFKVITGNGKNLDISPVYNHIKIKQPHLREKKKNIIIPNNKSKNKK